MPVPPGEDPSVGLTLSRIRLVLDSGSRFSLVDAGIPFAGTFTRTGEMLALEPKTVFGRNVDSDPAWRHTIEVRTLPNRELEYRNPNVSLGPATRLRPVANEHSGETQPRPRP